MGVGALWELYKVTTSFYPEDVFDGAVCDRNNVVLSNSKLEFWSYMYYLSKFWEVREIFASLFLTNVSDARYIYPGLEEEAANFPANVPPHYYCDPLLDMA